MKKKSNVRTCEKCGATYRKRPHQTWAEFDRRKYCSRLCASVAYERDVPPNTCECGAPVETAIWARFISSSGITYSAQMHLCRACAAEIDNPLPGPEPAGTLPVFGWGTRRSKQDADAWYSR